MQSAGVKGGNCAEGKKKIKKHGKEKYSQWVKRNA